MPQIQELRVVLPFTEKEYAVGHLFGNERFRQRNTNKTTTRIVSQTITTSSSTGYLHIHSRKSYVIASFLPIWIQKFLGADKVSVECETKDDYPSISQHYYVPLLKDKLSFSVKSIVVDNDRGQTDNALNLSPSELKHRTVLFADLTDDVQTDMVGGSPEDDPKVKQTSRGVLTPGYQSTVTPCCCLYVLISVHVNIWPAALGSRGEAFILKELRETVLKVARITVCTFDEWKDKTIQEITKMQQDLLNALTTSPTSNSTSTSSTSLTSLLSKTPLAIRSRL